ncbi:unnamed protein product [Polarella glacialis]|uniref:Uncharacterized protein n=1 Tax=Polarella glacialis TaxID=89957 RepID=A0A813J1Z2_POLGL|nr:unnamed protein product [Polarella glacialis]
MAACQDREAAILKRLADPERQTKSKLKRDDHLSDRKYAQLKRDAEDSVALCEQGRRRFEEQAQTELATVRDSLAEASKVRSQADDDIVAALDHYTQELQRAIASMSQTQLAAAGRT